MDNIYRSRRNILLIIDILAIVLSFAISYLIRGVMLRGLLGKLYGLEIYSQFMAYAMLIYNVVFLIKRKPRLERQSIGEIILITVEQQLIFLAVYIMIFFVFRRTEHISRIFIALFGVLNIVLCSFGRIMYSLYCHKRTEKLVKKNEQARRAGVEEMFKGKKSDTQHVYIIGSKSIGLYGGYESFLLNLLNEHEKNSRVQYHVACKASGVGYMNLKKLPGAVSINDEEFTYCNAHCVLMEVPDKFGSAQAIYYDLYALRWACEHIEKNHIGHPIVYILASRIGPFEKKYVDRIHDAGGQVYQNPDGHEDWRAKWNFIIRRYWKFSERMAVKRADLIVCDSKTIEEYIKEEYSDYNPKTTFIAYGANTAPSELKDNDERYHNWLANHNLEDRNFYTVVGRCVPENNFETIIREYMRSNTTKDLALITTKNKKMLKELDSKLHYKSDKRIKFVGTVYDQELLHKIRENSYGYFHGHSVGGTNPSLLEALASTDINLLYDVGFNREVAEDAALYWTLEDGSLAKVINAADKIGEAERAELGKKAKARIEQEYSWKYICDKYDKIFEI